MKCNHTEQEWVKEWKEKRTKSPVESGYTYFQIVDLEERPAEMGEGDVVFYDEKGYEIGGYDEFEAYLGERHKDTYESWKEETGHDGVMYSDEEEDLCHAVDCTVRNIHYIQVEKEWFVIKERAEAHFNQFRSSYHKDAFIRPFNVEKDSDLAIIFGILDKINA